MNDGAPPSLPFDPPGETIAKALSEQLDFKARLDTLERKLDAVNARVGVLGGRIASFQADVERCGNAATTNQGTLEKLERLLARIAVKLGVSP